MPYQVAWTPACGDLSQTSGSIQVLPKGGLCGEGDTGNVTAFCGSLMRFLVRYCLLLLAASQQHACPTKAERQQ